MFVGLIGAIHSGRNPNSNFAYHHFYTGMVILAFSVHGSGGVLGTPIGDYVVLAVALGASLIISLYFAFYPTRKSNVDLQLSACIRGIVNQKKKVYFLLLVTDNPTHQPVPPGSLFNIYDKRGGSYPFVHAHPFPVFSSSPRRLVFFIRCRFSKSKTRPSFTRTLYKNVNDGSYLN